MLVMVTGNLDNKQICGPFYFKSRVIRHIFTNMFGFSECNEISGFVVQSRAPKDDVITTCIISLRSRASVKMANGQFTVRLF